jgi:2-polyprenyl-3-methyl-5-hydroxy-6-metoxy-1,4-benzoquinol methylase
MRKPSWWEEEYGFFGIFYRRGDNSEEGHLAEESLSLKERTLLEVDGIINLLRTVSGQKILDIPCGYGRHSLELAKRKFAVTGSDINTDHLTVASMAAENRNLSITFRKEDMRRIKYANEFDAVINMFFSFGFFATDEENMQVLKNFFRALKPDGKFLMHTDVNIPRIISGKYKLNETRSLSSDNTLRIDETFNQNTKRLEGSWTIVRPHGDRTKEYSVRVYEKDEFIQMCLSAGFRGCEAYGSWKSDPYSEDSEEIMFVATK